MTISCPQSCPFHTGEHAKPTHEAVVVQESRLGKNRRVGNLRVKQQPQGRVFTCTICGEDRITS